MNQMAKLSPQHSVKFYSLANDLLIAFRCVVTGTHGKVAGHRTSTPAVDGLILHTEIVEIAALL